MILAISNPAFQIMSTPQTKPLCSIQALFQTSLVLINKDQNASLLIYRQIPTFKVRDCLTNIPAIHGVNVSITLIKQKKRLE